MELIKLPSGYDAIILSHHPELKKQIDEAILNEAERYDIGLLDDDNRHWAQAEIDIEYNGTELFFRAEATVAFILKEYSNGEVFCADREIVDYEYIEATADGEDIEVFETEYQYQRYNLKSA